MTTILLDLEPQSLVTAVEANRFEFNALVFGRWPEAELHDGPDMLSYVTSVPFPLFNGIHRASLPAERLDDAIENALGPFRSKKVPMFWWTGPQTSPAYLGSRLEAHGLVHTEDVPGMALDLRGMPDQHGNPPHFSVERVRDLPSLEKWADIVLRSFGLPDFVSEPGIDIFRVAGLGADSPIRHYVGNLDGQHVAASTLFLGAGVAGIYNVGTLPAARKRGIGAAMTWTPLREAREEGFRVGILHSSVLGKGVYEGLGFRERCTLGCYLWLPSPE